MNNEKLVELLVRCKADSIVTVTTPQGQFAVGHVFTMSKVVGNRTYQTICLGVEIPGGKAEADQVDRSSTDQEPPPIPTV